MANRISDMITNFLSPQESEGSSYSDMMGVDNPQKAKQAINIDDINNESKDFYSNWENNPITKEKRKKDIETGRASYDFKQLPFAINKKEYSTDVNNFLDNGLGIIKNNKAEFKNIDGGAMATDKGTIINPDRIDRGKDYLLGLNTHELTHRGGFDDVYADYLSKGKEDKITNSNIQHKNELYPRFMQMREMFGLNPGDEITKEMLNKNKENPVIKDLRSIYSDDEIINHNKTIAGNRTDNGLTFAGMMGVGDPPKQAVSDAESVGDKSLGMFTKGLNTAVTPPKIKTKKRTTTNDEGAKSIGDKTEMAGDFPLSTMVDSKANDKINNVEEVRKPALGFFNSWFNNPITKTKFLKNIPNTSEEDINKGVEHANTIPFNLSKDLPLFEYGNHTVNYGTGEEKINIADMLSKEYAIPVGVHELTHGANFDNIFSKIAPAKDVVIPKRNDDKPKGQATALEKDYEAYPDIMQMRKTLNLKPGDKVTNKHINSLDEKGDDNIKRLRDRGYKDEDILQMFNEWALNKGKQEVPNFAGLPLQKT